MKEVKIENWYDTLYIRNLEVYDDVAFVFVNTSEDHPNLRKMKILNDTLKQCHNMTSNLIYLIKIRSLCNNAFTKYRKMPLCI